MHKWKESGRKVTHVRLDNAGENNALHKRCNSKDWKLAVEWEFTCQNTPQQNSIAEVALWTIHHRGMAMMKAANIPKKIQYVLFKEAFRTASMLDGLVPVKINGVTKTRYEHWMGKLPKFVDFLRIWGEAGTVAYKMKTSSTLEDRGRQCMMIGYEIDHPGDCYRMWYPKHNTILITRDVTWLHRMFFQPEKLKIKTPKVITKLTDGKGGNKDDVIMNLSVEEGKIAEDEVSELFETESAMRELTISKKQNNNTTTNQSINHNTINNDPIQGIVDTEDNEQNNTDKQDDHQMGTVETVNNDNDDEMPDHVPTAPTPAADPFEFLQETATYHEEDEMEIEFEENETDQETTADKENKEDDDKESSSISETTDSNHMLENLELASQQETVRRSHRNRHKPTWTKDYVVAGSAISKYIPPHPHITTEYVQPLNPNDIMSDDELCEIGRELAMVGVGNNFDNTHELHTMTYRKAMKSPDKCKWELAIEEEYRKMNQYKVFTPVPKEQVPHNAKILSTKWVMKKKPNGTYRARLTARGYEQEDGVHFDEHTIASPVVDDLTVRIIMVLTIMGSWEPQLVDVKGAFLHGTFEDKHKMYMRVPEGFEKWYGSAVFLLLLKAIYGTKQAAIRFWTLLVSVFRIMAYSRSQADPCLFFKWTTEWGLLVWLSWVDDCLCTGKDDGVVSAKNEFKKHFEVDDLGLLTEYVGCKIEYDRDRRRMKLTQPVLIQSINDEFDIPTCGQEPRTPAAPGQVLPPYDPSAPLSPEELTKFRSGVGKMIHLMKWSRPEISYAVHELSKYMKGANAVHVKAMHRLFRFLLLTKERGLVLQPDAKWDGNPEFLFDIMGISDTNYAAHVDGRKSVSGWSVFLNMTSIRVKSRQQNCVTLSVTESEMIAACECAQDMIRAENVLTSMGLKVRHPMTLYVDNRGVVDLVNSWNVGGRTRHVDVRYWWLRELKENNRLIVKWVPTDKNTADLFTKNLPEAVFNVHAPVFVSDD